MTIWTRKMLQDAPSGARLDPIVSQDVTRFDYWNNLPTAIKRGNRWYELTRYGQRYQWAMDDLVALLNGHHNGAPVNSQYTPSWEYDSSAYESVRTLLEVT